MAKRTNLKVEFIQDKKRAWRWHVRAKNGKLVCTAGEAFASKSNAKRAWKAFLKGVTEIKE